jgi:hypothetical protein
MHVNQSTTTPGTGNMSAALYNQKLATVLSFSIARLKESLSASTGLFDRQLREKKWDATIGTEDMTSTAICLIGIHRSGNAQAVGLDVPRTLDALMEVGKRRGYAGGAGLSLWANAVWQGKPFASVMEAMGLDPAGHNAVLGGLTTMEVAWLVSGLVHEFKRSGDVQARTLLAQARAELLGRFVRSAALVEHCGPRGSIRDRVRRAVPNFADQVYSLQATAFLAIEQKDQESLAMSEAIAGRILQHQGARGQWWWHYNTRTGGVAQPFPVYSVHQHGMAPMALLALKAAGGPDNAAAIARSSSWLFDNEMQATLVDEEAGTIWRDLEYAGGGAASLARQARSIMGIRNDEQSPVLKVNYETRPYEWAWCIYAAAIAAGKEKGLQVV